MTHFAQLMGTPLYMAPEQAELSAVDVDTRSDVFSLGVLMYELLTGTTPFEREKFSDVSFDELRRIIREDEPPRPSTRLSTLDAALETEAEKRATDGRTLSQQLHGELDWIVMKALEKDRTRRYQTAADLARDVQRYLDDEPVEACPPSKIYRFRKFARRNKTALAAGTAVALALMVGAGIATWQAYRATKAEQQARQQHGRAEENLRLALEVIDQVYLQYADDKSFTFAPSISGEPASPEPITPEGEKFLRKAVTFYEQFAQANQDDPRVRHETAKAHIRVANIRNRLKMYNEAETASTQAIAIAKELVSQFPDVPEYHVTLVQAHFQRGCTYLWRSQYDKAIADLSKAIRLDPKFVWPYAARGVAFRAMGDFDKAMADFCESIRVDPKYAPAYRERGIEFRDREPRDYEKAIADFTEAIRLDPKYTAAYMDRGIAYRDREPRELEKAFADFAEAIRVGPNSPLGYHVRGHTYCWTTGEYDKAIADCSEAIRIDPKFAAAYNERGVAYRMSGELDKAITDLTEATRLEPTFVWPYRHRAEAYELKGEFGKAIADYSEAIRIDPKDAGVYNKLAWILATCPDSRLQDATRAVELAEDAVKLEPNNPKIWNTLGAARYRAGNWKTAIEALQKSQEIGGAHSYDSFFLAMAHWQLDNKEEARQWYDKAVEWMEGNDPEDEELQRFRDEAAEVLGIEKQSTLEDKKEEPHAEAPRRREEYTIEPFASSRLCVRSISNKKAAGEVPLATSLLTGPASPAALVLRAEAMSVGIVAEIGARDQGLGARGGRGNDD